MNQGARLADVLANVKAPAHLLAKPYLRPVYDQPEFIVRNVWRLYGGWWDGSPSSLEPAHPSELARELTRFCGGPKTMIDRALSTPDDATLAAVREEVVTLAEGFPLYPGNLAGAGAA